MPFEPPHSLPIHNADGVDLTLIRWMLTLTPVERVEYIQGLVDSLEEIRELNDDTEST